MKATYKTSLELLIRFEGHSVIDNWRPVDLATLPAFCLVAAQFGKKPLQVAEDVSDLALAQVYAEKRATLALNLRGLK